MGEQQVTQKDKYVTFKSGNEYFGLKIEYVNEIIICQDITAVPESPEYIKGLINLRGKIIPVVDVRIRFKQEPFEYDDRTCIIVIHVKDVVVGLIVEKIAEVVEIGEEDIIPTPTMNFGGHAERVQNKYVYAVGKVGEAVKLLLDPDRLINDDEILALEQTAEETEEEDSEEAQETEGNKNADENSPKEEKVSVEKKKDVKQEKEEKVSVEEKASAKEAEVKSDKKEKGKSKSKSKDKADDRIDSDDKIII